MLSTLIACLLVLLALLFRKSFKYFSSRGLHHVRPSWKVVVKSFISPSKLINYPNEIYDGEKNTDNSIVGYFSVFMTPTLLVVEPSMAQNVFIKDFSHFQDHVIHMDPSVDPLAGHLFNMSGDKWRALRNKLLPAFTSGKLKGMIPTIENCALSVIKDMKQDASLRQDVNLKDLFKNFTGAVIASCAFGIEPDSVKNPNCEYQQMLKRAFSSSRLSKVKHLLMFTFPKLTTLLKWKLMSQEVDDFFINLTKDTMEMRKKSGVKRNDFIQLLMELKEKGSVQVDHRDLEEDEKNLINQQQKLVESESTSKLEMTYELLAAQVFVFLLAGLNNSSYLVAITTYLLGKHKDIQQRVREEVRAAKSKHGGFNYEALKDMKLLEACINEALRKFPSVMYLFRMCTKNYNLLNGSTIEKGMQVIIPAKALQNDSRYWKNPEEFIPDRFLTDDLLPGTYMPFGDGPRLCIAQRLALLKGKILLAELVDNFDLLPSKKNQEPLRPKFMVISDFHGGLWGNFHPLRQ